MNVVVALLAGCMTFVAQNAAPRPDCGDWTDCRGRALDAEARKDFEAFHDFAWRAAQRGTPGDPSLLFLVARAQSLSGRPHDALVMLRRLGSQAVAREALTREEFARVRALPAWTEVEAAILGNPAPAPGTLAPAPGTPAPAPSMRHPAPAPGTTSPAPLTFDAGSFTPAALAYDLVSKRFIIADADISRLAVIDEFTRNLATLASGGPGRGFGTVTAIEIDPRAGDLWMASVDASGKPALHKLQLISARMLKDFAAPPSAAGRFVDLDVAGDGTIVVADESRVFSLRPGAAAFAPIAAITHGRIAAAAVADGGAVYLALEEGIERVGRGSLKAPAGASVAGMWRLRWSAGSLVGMRRSGEGAYEVVRLRLNADGGSIAAIDVVDTSVKAPRPVAALAGGVFYYLSQGDGHQYEIRRFALRRE